MTTFCKKHIRTFSTLLLITFAQICLFSQYTNLLSGQDLDFGQLESKSEVHSPHDSVSHSTHNLYSGDLLGEVIDFEESEDSLSEKKLTSIFKQFSAIYHAVCIQYFSEYLNSRLNTVNEIAAFPTLRTYLQLENLRL